jgi:hypothetical protein
MRTGKTTKRVPASAPLRVADHLRSNADIAIYIEEMLSDGDARAVPIATSYCRGGDRRNGGPCREDRLES